MRGSGPAEAGATSLAGSAALQPLGYAGLRLRWCAAAMRAFVARWGLYGLVAAALIGAGSDSPVASVAGVAAWTVLPLFQAASQAGPLAGVVLLQSMLGGLLVWAMRPLLWNPRWRPVERALPLAAPVLRRSDAAVVALGLLPLLALYGVGAAAWWVQRPAWLLPWAWQAGAGWVLMVAGSWLAGWAVMRAWRRAGPGPWPPRGPTPAAGPAGGRPISNAPAHRRRRQPGPGVLRRPQAWWWALALWRGPARRTGVTALLGGLGLAGWVLAGTAWGPTSGLAAWQGWWLAGFAGLGLVVSTRVNQLSRAKYQPLIDACAVLPLSRQALSAQRALWALLPLGLPLALLAALLPWPGLRVPLALAYLAANAAASAWEVAWPASDPAARASRWGVWLVLLVALASEVMP